MCSWPFRNSSWVTVYQRNGPMWRSAASQRSGRPHQRKGQHRLRHWLLVGTIQDNRPHASIPMSSLRLLTTADVDGTAESMKGIEVAVITGNIPANLVERQLPIAKGKGFASPEEALVALRDGQIDTPAGGNLWRNANLPGSKMLPERPNGRSGMGAVPSPMATMGCWPSATLPSANVARLCRRRCGQHPSRQSLDRSRNAPLDSRQRRSRTTPTACSAQ